MKNSTEPKRKKKKKNEIRVPRIKNLVRMVTIPVVTRRQSTSKLALTRPGGRGFSPAPVSMRDFLKFIGHKRKIEPKELRSC